MTQPKVSVLIPVSEIICINDGSTDRSASILQEYARKDRRIKVHDKSNGGYGSAMNVGLKHVTGQYIGIVEPDDTIKPEMYQRLYEQADKYQAELPQLL